MAENDAGASSRKKPRGTRPPTAAEARAAVVPFARAPSERGARLVLSLRPAHALVSSATLKQIHWGGVGHRDGLLHNAPTLVTHVRSLLSADDARAADGVLELSDAAFADHLDEWAAVPFAIERLEPCAGHVFVTAERARSIAPGSAAYFRRFIEEGVPPEQVPTSEYDAAQTACRTHEIEHREQAKAFGECAPLGVRLTIVRTKGDGDCFFSALVKAFGGKAAGGRGSAVSAPRDLEVWKLAHGEGTPPPAETEPLTVAELRAACAACYTESTWLVGHSLRLGSCGYAQWAFVDDTLEGTRARIRAPAAQMGERAYWADESAVATVQRYLHCRLLLFHPQAGGASRFQAIGDVDERADRPMRWVVLRRTHAKAQHYELYALGDRAVFQRDELPDGVVRAFSGRVAFDPC
ncbi:hypothetical protein KFE25_001142 [Diacronema lutheri]|uniref:OTU domain-containing protein n=1 Tax=Diacronema lutheri TaxID=2081491 RepID=A0A8J5X853_DIALT|nr:hypothetical protein KFE25_001142 [Diacronema lutheri]